MAGSLDSLADLLARLRIVGDPVFILKELKTAVLALPSNELENLSRTVSLAPVFDSLNSSDKEQISLACDLLNSMLSTLSPNAILPQFQAELYRGLSHPEPLVKGMVLQQIKRCVSHQLLENSHATVLAIVQLSGDDDLGVAKYANETLVEMSKTRSGLNSLFDPNIVREMKGTMGKSDIVRFRIYEVIIKIAKESREGLKHCIDSELITYLLNEYRQDDILIQLNCLELISELAMVDHTLRYLEDNGVIAQLETMLQHASVDSLGGFYLPGLIKFFGNMGYLHPKKVCERYRPFVNILFKYVESTDNNLLLVAIDTVSLIGSTVEGKLTLERFNSHMTNCMLKLGSVISNAPSELRVKAMQATALLLELKTEDQTTELLQLTYTWFTQLNLQAMQLLYNLCRQPFADLRCAALRILQAIAYQPWGQQKMNAYPGFLEYLFDRNTEPDKEGKELKFDLVMILIQSPTSREIFGTAAMVKLKEFGKEGPFFVLAQAEVAVDGAS